MHDPVKSAREVFVATLKLAPDRWDAYLEAACGEDDALRRRVRDLLDAHREAGSFMESSATRPVATVQDTVHEGPGTLVGPYQLLEPIGEGGMGTVYLAQQTEPVQRLVALKVIKPGMDSRQVIARFEVERQALALMDHPNIAKIHDGGTTASGRPYFVMELVKGVPLTRYCDEQRLTPRQRLDLFVPVCQAVQHAHQKGIIHRDLKPSNVLIAIYDGRPVPKVIDFGVAKAVGPPLTEETIVTGFGALVGTLEYMAPEQAEPNNVDVDTRSDVYSLGVLLYELLTGTTPLQRKRVQEAGLLETLRLIREEETPRPSTRLSGVEELPSIAASRSVEPRRLTGLVRGELDWVVMKALDKDRKRRYETASAFAADVERYLHDEPVQACPPSSWYRLRKFARRNRGTVLAAAALLSALLITLSLTLYSNARVTEALTERTNALSQLEAEQQKTKAAWRDSEQKAAEIREGLEKLNAANVFLERGRACVDHPHQPSVRRAGALDALEAFDRAVALRPDHSLARDVRGQFFCRLGLFAEAVVDLERAYALRRPGNVKLDGASFDLWYRYACLRARAGNWKGYREVCAQMIEHLERSTDRALTGYWAAKTCGLAPGGVADPGQAVALAQEALKRGPRARYTLFALGMAHYRAGQRPEAIRRLQEAEGMTTVWEPHALIWLGLALANARPGDTAAAVQWFDRAHHWLDLQIDPTDDPALFALPVPWWQDWAHLELLYKEAATAVRGQAAADHPAFHLVPARGYTLIGRGVQAAEAAARADQLRPGDARVRRAVGAVQAAVARGFGPPARQPNKPGKALDATWTPWGEIARLEELVKKFPAVPDYPRAIAKNLHGLAMQQRKSGGLTLARELLSRAIRHQQVAVKIAPEHATARQDLRDYYGNLAEILLLLKDHAEAARVAAELPRVSRDGWGSHRPAAELLVRCVVLAEKDTRLAAAQRQAAAQAYAEQAKRLLQEARQRIAAAKPPAAEPNKGNANKGPAEDCLSLAYVSLALGDLPSAREATRSAVAMAPDDLNVLFVHGAVLVLAGDDKEYRQLCGRVLQRAGRTKDSSTAYAVARICTLAPDAVADPARVVAVAQRVAKSRPGAATLHKLGTAHYRARQFDLAIKRLNESLKKRNDWQVDILNYLVLAMAHHQLGQAGEARDWLVKAVRWIDEASAETPGGSVGPLGKMTHGAWLPCRVLRREAELLINGKSASPPMPKTK